MRETRLRLSFKRSRVAVCTQSTVAADMMFKSCSVCRVELDFELILDQRGGDTMSAAVDGKERFQVNFKLLL